MFASAPTAGGQYHLVSEFAPPHLQKFLSYYSGELAFLPSPLSLTPTDFIPEWLSALAWLTGAASSLFLPGDIIPAVAALANPSYHPEPWHSYLVILGVTALSYIINVYLVNYLPLLEGFIAAYMIIVFFSVVITLLVLSPKNSAEVAFQSFEPIVGGTNGIMAVLASQVLLFFSLLGSDTLIILGSSVAFQAIMSLGILALAFTYEMSILCLIWRRLYGAPLPPCAWSLERSGLSINIAASVYGLYLMFFSVLPLEYPVTAVNFNWSPVMFIAVMGFAAVYYALVARKVYQGPVVVCQPMYT